MRSRTHAICSAIIISAATSGRCWGVVTGLIGGPSGSRSSRCRPAPQAAVPASRWQLFWLLNLVLAIGASWLGNGLWNAASKRLPLTLSGQLIVFETVFAMLYAFVHDRRMPHALEIAALVLLLTGVYGSVRHGDTPPAAIRREARGSANAAAH